jgi:hypothetical protein
VDAGLDRVHQPFPQARGDADGRGVDVAARVEVVEVGPPERAEVEAGRPLEALVEDGQLADLRDP